MTNNEKIAKVCAIKAHPKPIDYMVFRVNVLIELKNNEALLMYLHGADEDIQQEYAKLFNHIDELIKLEASRIVSL